MQPKAGISEAGFGEQPVTYELIKGVAMAGQVNEANVEKVFTYQKATPEQEDAYKAIRSASISLANVILAVVPNCADRSTALRSLRETRMWANAAIALDGEV